MFKLTRYFSIASLVGILAVLAVLVFFYRHLAFGALKEHEARANASLTQVFANTVWPRYFSFVDGASGTPKTELPQRPEVAQLRGDVLRQMKGSNVVKVKIYNLDGLTVFSTDPNEIGEDQRSNARFLSAKEGGIASEITFRKRFDAFEEVIADRNLVSSYIPIRQAENPRVEAVLEVY